MRRCEYKTGPREVNLIKRPIQKNKGDARKSTQPLKTTSNKRFEKALFVVPAKTAALPSIEIIPFIPNVIQKSGFGLRQSL